MDDQATRDLPRILCLHGGGVTAEIFKLQMRSLTRALSPHFRLVFPDAPFLCNPGPGMLPVFANMGPYRRWLRWIPEEHPEVDDETVVDEIEYAMRAAMDADDAAGGRGDWIGLLGFSQGAKMAASMLYDAELRWRAARRAAGYPDRVDFRDWPAALDAMPPGLAGRRWRFAACLNGRSPLVKLGPLSAGSATMLAPAAVSEGGLEFDYVNGVDRLSLPTLHVHGLQDPGLHLHRRLHDFYCEKGTTEVIEWDGGHRIPLKTADIQRVAAGVLRIAKSAGVVPDDAVLATA